MNEQQKGAAPSTPSAQWRANGEPDPHGNAYDCERAALALGRMTDDELANAVYMHDFTIGSAHYALRGLPSGIALLTAAKDRIRWLSRALEATQVPAEPVAWRHSHTHSLAETQADVELADGDEWAEPLFLGPLAARRITNEDIRRVFLENGFTIKEGQNDLKPYVFAAARALLALAASPRATAEQVAK